MKFQMIIYMSKNLPAVSRGRTAAIKVPVCTSAGASHAALGVSTDIDIGDRGGEGRLGRRGCLHSGRCGRFAGGLGAAEGFEAGGGIAVVDGRAAPSILAALEWC